MRSPQAHVFHGKIAREFLSAYEQYIRDRQLRRLVLTVGTVVAGIMKSQSKPCERSSIALPRRHRVKALRAQHVWPDDDGLVLVLFPS